LIFGILVWEYIYQGWGAQYIYQGWGIRYIYQGWGVQMSIMVGASRCLSWLGLPDVYHRCFLLGELHRLRLFFKLEEIPIDHLRTARASQHHSKDENFSTLPEQQELLNIDPKTRLFDHLRTARASQRRSKDEIFRPSQNSKSFSTSLQR
jgi:hypothetical protein